MAAKRLAKKVAEDFGTEVGNDVGYWVGSRGGNDNKKVSDKTRLMFVTDGVLLHNPTLRPGAIVIDEAHERGKDTDLLLARPVGGVGSTFPDLVA